MKTKIIAEIGWSHCGDMSLAKEMISAAAESGVDYVKFQSWSAKNLKPGPWNNDGRKELYDRAEIMLQDHEILIDFCKQNNVEFLTSLFSVMDFDKLPNSYGTKCIKIPSTEINNTELIKKCDFETIFISTGAATIQEVQDLLALFPDKNIVLLHCVSMYPCGLEFSNMRKIQLLKLLHDKVGYSDHTMGVEAPFYAISNGIMVLEKHFTVDRNLPGRDNKFAATPDEMKKICEFRDASDIMTKNLTADFMDGELSARNDYRQRWCKNG